MKEVLVTNKNPKAFTDSYAGMKFTFNPNEKVAIPLEAAVHIFGFNKMDKTSTKIRLGISNHPGGDEFLGNFKMEFVEYVRKDDAEEIEQLKIDLEAKNAEIEKLKAALEKAETENAQLETKLDKASKKAEK